MKARIRLNWLKHSTALVLASLVMLLTIASVSPALHASLHPEDNHCQHGCTPEPNTPDSGYCAVYVFDQGLLTGCSLSIPTPTFCSMVTYPMLPAHTYCERTPLKLSARAPPTVS